MHTLQFAQNVPDGPVLDPILENFPITPSHQPSQKQGYTNVTETPFKQPCYLFDEVVSDTNFHDMEILPMLKKAANDIDFKIKYYLLLVPIFACLDCVCPSMRQRTAAYRTSIQQVFRQAHFPT